MLAKRLLSEHLHIKLILMSATVHTDLYKQYFSSSEMKGQYMGNLECLSVGVRRFPIDIKYLDDLMKTDRTLPPTIATTSKTAMGFLKSSKGVASEQINNKFIECQYKLVENLVRTVVMMGTCVLIFVSGINDITDLAEKFEGLSKYHIYMIHSDIPFEEQEAAFLPTPANEIKVVLATNAAESSITLPDCDVVICCGTHKSMQYNLINHRAVLSNGWISKASATQRAGRTGRVRPGNVYRLYSKQLFDSLSEHELSEVHRTPLQDIILNLRVMFESAHTFTGVVPLLQELVEPPEIANVDRSFEYLYNANMITSPNDQGTLTALGKFAGQLPIDLKLR